MLDGISSKHIEHVVEHFSSLPGIGKKTALRFALHLLKKESEDVSNFGEALIAMRESIQYCSECHNISDEPTCSICSNPNRSQSSICVVQDIRDVIAIENTNSFSGKYHVLGGIISPMDGIGPNDLNIDSLIEKVSQRDKDEIILALPATMEGDTTNFYLYKKLKDFEVKITTIAKGVSIGDDIQYTDQLTLGRSIMNRTLFDQSVNIR